MIDKYLDKTMIALSKVGKAPLVFTVAKYPGDEKFDKDPPHIDLYIIPFLDEFEKNIIKNIRYLFCRDNFKRYAKGRTYFYYSG